MKIRPEYREILHSWRAIAACAVCYWVLCAVYGVYAGDIMAYGLAWNIFLALLPLAFAQAAVRCTARSWKVLLWCAWLLFLPNTFYTFTDILHVTPNLEWIQDGATIHMESGKHWARLVLIALCVVFGVLLGVHALTVFFDAARKAIGAPAAWGGVAFMSLLSGVGIYLGRFLRLNSWDILHPLEFLGTLAQGELLFGAKVILMFSAAIFLIFVFYHALQAGAQNDVLRIEGTPPKK